LKKPLAGIWQAFLSGSNELPKSGMQNTPLNDNLWIAVAAPSYKTIKYRA